MSTTWGYFRLVRAQKKKERHNTTENKNQSEIPLPTTTYSKPSIIKTGTIIEDLLELTSCQTYQRSMLVYDRILPEGVYYWRQYSCGEFSHDYTFTITSWQTQLSYKDEIQWFYWRKDNAPDAPKYKEIYYKGDYWDLGNDGAINKEEYDKEIQHRILEIMKWKERIDDKLKPDGRYRG
jgi:hypothetical protein